MKTLLAKLQLDSVNLGACSGPEKWIDSGASPLTSYNPTTGAPIAQVIQMPFIRIAPAHTGQIRPGPL